MARIGFVDRFWGGMVRRGVVRISAVGRATDRLRQLQTIEGESYPVIMTFPEVGTEVPAAFAKSCHHAVTCLGGIAVGTGGIAGRCYRTEADADVAEPEGSAMQA